MSTVASKTGFSPLKVKCPLCESAPFKACKENDRAVIHPYKPEFHAEREAAYLASVQPEPEPTPEPVPEEEKSPPTQPGNEPPPAPTGNEPPPAPTGNEPPPAPPV